MHAAVSIGRSSSPMIAASTRRIVSNTLTKQQTTLKATITAATTTTTFAGRRSIATTVSRPSTLSTHIPSVRSIANSKRTMATDSSSEQLVLTETRGPVRILTLNRPKALNALSTPLFIQLNAHLLDAQHDDSIRAIVLTGGKKVWAAGADIKEMKDKSFAEVYKGNMLGSWDEVIVGKVTKPVIGAVNGYALGGGCELAMMCDILIASPTAVFGQPEINLGIIPGAGGTQRLTKIVGKAIAMDMVLTGRRIDAKEAERHGLVSRVVWDESKDVIDEAVKIGEEIAAKGAISVQAGKEAVNGANELSLAEGLRLEKRLFHQLFATKDQKEGMAAFAEKRKAAFSHL